ncbi:MAG TPA: hypothetical protein VK427_05275 [Kofleriaceae bacterium]|nr:hypothetical protein [Kofleriaceae bacterium]
MACASREELAAGTADAAHLATCPACRRARAEQVEVASMLSELRTAPLAAARRDALAAEVMAAADVMPARRRPSFARWSTLAAAAAAIVVVTVGFDRAALAPSLASRPAPVARTATPHVDPSPAPSAIRDVIESARSAPALSRAPAPRSATMSPATMSPAPPRVAERRATVKHQVFGSSGTRQPPAIDREVVSESGLAPFRVGWEALRAARYAEAITAFDDAARDPIVAEDAAYWAAIAAWRNGAHDDARRRLADVAARWPQSPRADDARRALDSVR